MSRKELVTCFADTMEIANGETLSKETKKAFDGTVVYEEGFVSEKRTPITNGDVFVIEMTTFDAARKYSKGRKTAVLNFANPVNPGGGVQNGAMAQEECLCRSSNLYPCLCSAEAREKYYDYHKNLNNNTASDRIIYTRDVCVFKTDDEIPQLMDQNDWFYVDVITCAAPYQGGIKKIKDDVLKPMFKSRIKNIFETALDNSIEVLILGAFGCGAFRNPPALVAEAFKEVINEENYLSSFDTIVFAIKKTKNQNYEIFRSILVGNNQQETNENSSSNKKWYGVGAKNDRNEGWGEETEFIIDTCLKNKIEFGSYQMQGGRFIGVHCTEKKIHELMDELGQNEYGYGVMTEPYIGFIKQHENKMSEILGLPRQKVEGQEDNKNTESSRHKKEKKESKKPDINSELTNAINIYNNQYELMNGEGINLYHQRDKAIDVIAFVEKLINSIANHPKSFDTDLKEVDAIKESFNTVDQYVEKEIAEAKKQAIDAGVGVAAGAGVAAITPTVAMWVATTFGTASTGTAISALSGAAATNAALAWLGGGALTAGGLGMAGGQALLALAGPVGWGIAGASVLASVVLFANNKLKSNKEKAKEIASIKANTETLKELAANIHDLVEKTISLKNQLSEEYTNSLDYYNCNYAELKDNQKKELGALVNNTKALAALINTSISLETDEE